MMMADKGYSHNRIYTPPTEAQILQYPELEFYATALNQQRSLIEHVIGKIKMKWRILDKKFPKSTQNL